MHHFEGRRSDRSKTPPSVLLAAALCCGLASRVSAQDTPSSNPSASAPKAAPESTQKPSDPMAAQRAYERGLEALGKGDYAGAEGGFHEAFELSGQVMLLLRIADVQEKQDKKAEAAATLSRYLEALAAAPEKADIEARIVGLKNGAGIVRVESEPRGAEVVLDGEPTGQTTPIDLKVTPGSHKIAVLAEGYDSPTQTIDVALGKRHEVKLTLNRSEPLPKEEQLFGGSQSKAPAIPDSATQAKQSDGPSAAVWVATGIGGAALITGTVLGFLALSQKSQFDKTPTEKLADHGERLALFSDVAFGLAVASGVTALVLYLSEKEPPPAEDKKQAAQSRRTSARVRLHPLVSGHQVGLGSAIQF